MRLFDATLTQLEHALDVRLERQNLLASNLANADTPGFAPKDIDFKTAMAQADAQAPDAQPGDLPTSGALPSSSAVVDASSNSAGIDGNRVDVDRTMVSLAENALQYGAAAKAVGKKLAILRYVASDGAA